MEKKWKIIIIVAIVAIIIGGLIYFSKKKAAETKRLAQASPPAKANGLRDRIKSGEFKVKDVKMANKDILKNVAAFEVEPTV